MGNIIFINEKMLLKYPKKKKKQDFKIEIQHYISVLDRIHEKRAIRALDIFRKLLIFD